MDLPSRSKATATAWVQLRWPARRLGLIVVAAAALVLGFGVEGAAAALPVGSITEFSLPTLPSAPLGITAGPDGNLWFTEQAGGKIGRITPSGTITEYPLPSFDNPFGITAGPDGNLWFVEPDGNKIGRITPSGTITEFALQGANSFLEGITAGADGNLWFTEPFANNIGRITPSGTISEFALPAANSVPLAIAAGPDGNVWFTEGAGKIGRITTSGTITEFALPVGGFGHGITGGPDGNVWFTEFRTDKVGRITPLGTITEYPLPTTNSLAFGISTGPDGNIWFTENSGNKIGRITPSGTITEYPLPTALSGPAGIVAGPDGGVWFTEQNGNRIGRIQAVAADTTPPTISVPAPITADATSPSGAVVTYPVSATDPDDAVASLNCVPASGSTFPIGTTTVNCSATDTNGNTSTASFTVHVKGAAEQLADLLTAVTGVGPGTSLADKVSQARTYLTANDVPDACATLSGFIKEVTAQSGITIMTSQAATLIATAQRIEAVLGC
jgi:streptogramin lyase